MEAMAVIPARATLNTGFAASKSSVSLRQRSGQVCRVTMIASAKSSPRFVCALSGAESHDNSLSSSSTFAFPPSSESSKRLTPPGAVASENFVEIGGGGPFSGPSGKGGGGGGGSGGGGGNGGGGGDGERNRSESLAVLAALGKSVESIPKELADAVLAGRVPGAIMERFTAMEKSAILGRLVRVSGFQERLLADDLFFLKVFFECGVGMFTKTLAEYDRRKENFMKEINFVIADIVMALFADFMLVYLPAPTIALRAPAIIKGNKIASFFARCPDNAFQMALGGAKYNLLQRVGCVVRNGGKLMAVGTVSSLIGTGVTNALVASGKKKEAAATGKEVVKGEGELPLVATSVAYGAYMAVSSNLRYQILAGVIEQRMLDPLLRNHKIALSGASFCIRTLNTYLGSLLWVDYARLVGVQSHEAEAQAA